MDILYLVDRLENLIASSRRMPLVNGILIKEGDILNIVDQMRTSIPDEVKQARRIIQEKERAMNREGLLRTAEMRSQELVRLAQEQAHTVMQQAQEHSEHLKLDADAYVAETLRNLKDHLASIEMDISRTILSIDKGLDSLDIPEPTIQNREDFDEAYKAEAFEEEKQPPSRQVARRASLANDTIGGPLY